MTKYLIVDLANLAFRTKHVVRGDSDIKGGMAVHIAFQAIQKCWTMFNIDHVVIAQEGGNTWRRATFSQYKASRRVKANLRTPLEQEDDEIFFSYIQSFVNFLHEKTNVTVIGVPRCEADDVIARWIQLHPNDNHIILSSDSDFFQLLSDNVTMYNGKDNKTICIDRVLDDKGMPIIDKKTKVVELPPDPEWELFLKCMVGDPGDGVFRAAPPRLRKTVIREAYDDRETKGFPWNNIMLSTWEDHNSEIKTVLERYNANQILIDLTKQPTDIKDALDAAILEAVQAPKKSNVGIWLLKFCHEFSLKQIEDRSEKFIPFLNSGYK